MNANTLAATLSQKERRRFDACNQQIRDGLRSCFDTGAALAEVRDHKLYREDYETFEDYCRQMFDVSRAHAYRLIEAADLKSNLSPVGDKLITNEAQARELAKVPEAKRERVLKKVAAAGQVTAIAIAEIATPFLEKPDSIDRNVSPTGDKPVVDEGGYPVPDDLHGLWERRNEVEALSREVAALKNKFLALQCTDDLLWKGFEAQRAAGFCENIHQALSAVRLFAVCVICQGRGRKACAFCGGKGLISKFKWDSQATREAKDLRRQSLAMKGGS